MPVDVKKLIQELIVPELKEIKAEQKNLDTQFDALQSKMDSLRHEMDSLRSEVGSFRNEVGSFRHEMNVEMNSLRNEGRIEVRRMDEKLDIALQIRERLAVLESKVAASGK